MSYPDFSKAFQPGHKVISRLGDIILNSYEVGELVLTSGKLVACDPLCPFPAKEPFATNFKPGRYPVILSVAHYLKDNTSTVAYAMLRIEEQTPIKWKLAPFPDLDVDLLEEQGQSIGYIVDSGTGGFLDEEVVEILINSVLDTEEFEEDLLDKLIEIFEKISPLGWANMCVDDSTQANVIAFDSGGGDGIYPTYFGYDAEENVVCIVTDFFVCSLE